MIEVEQVFGGYTRRSFRGFLILQDVIEDYKPKSFFQQVFCFRGFIKSEGIC